MANVLLGHFLVISAEEYNGNGKFYSHLCWSLLQQGMVEGHQK